MILKYCTPLGYNTIYLCFGLYAVDCGLWKNGKCMST